MEMVYGILGEAAIQSELLIMQMRSLKAVIEQINTRIRAAQRSRAELPCAALRALASDITRLATIAVGANREAIELIDGTRSAIERALELLSRNHEDESEARAIFAKLQPTLQAFDVAEQVLHRYAMQASRDVALLHEMARRHDVPPEVVSTVSELLLRMMGKPHAP